MASQNLGVNKSGCFCFLSITHRLIFGTLLNSDTCSFGKSPLFVDHCLCRSKCAPLWGKRFYLEVRNDFSASITFSKSRGRYSCSSNGLCVPTAWFRVTGMVPFLGASCPLSGWGAGRLEGRSFHSGSLCDGCPTQPKEGREERRQAGRPAGPLLRNAELSSSRGGGGRNRKV